MYHPISHPIYTHIFPSLRLYKQRQMIVDLDSPQIVSVEQLEKTMFLNEIVFHLTPDQQIIQKLQKIDPLVPFLNRCPTIRTSFQLKQSQGFTPQFSHVAVGGTFDHLHIGHQVLLLYTALTATQRITIGVTGEALLIKKKLKPILQPWNIRMKHVESFVKSVKPTLAIRIFELNDPFGETVEVENMDALVISEETIRGGEKINEERANRKMKPLQLIVCPTISPQKDVQHKFSSTFVREYLLNKNCLTIEQYSEYRAFYDAFIERTLIKDRETIEDWWQRIFLNYSEHWRHYHTNQHIYRLLKEWNGESFAQRKKALSNQQLNIVELGIFFHDIVYRPDSKTNEEDSAQLANSFIRNVHSYVVEADDFARQVSLLILQTKNHEPSNALSQILYDLDMGILNSPKNYQEYARGIKKEYHPQFGEEYTSKRLQLLHKWKEEKHSFSFEPKNLVSNLAWEIYCLQNHDL